MSDSAIAWRGLKRRASLSNATTGIKRKWWSKLLLIAKSQTEIFHGRPRHLGVHLSYESQMMNGHIQKYFPIHLHFLHRYYCDFGLMLWLKSPPIRKHCPPGDRSFYSPILFVHDQNRYDTENQVSTRPHSQPFHSSIKSLPKIPCFLSLNPKTQSIKSTPSSPNPSSTKTKGHLKYASPCFIPLFSHYILHVQFPRSPISYTSMPNDPKKNPNKYTHSGWNTALPFDQRIPD